MRDYHIHTLANGIRVVHNPVTSTGIVHIGIMLDIGSRDESLSNQGIAHFWEHMAFKGTRSRNSFHILNRLESVGGELNAFTDKEKILFYASLRDQYFERALELLTDITFESIFPTHQILRERNVILEEMSMYDDDPDGSLQDEFDALIFKGHPLGMKIIGTRNTVQSFRRQAFQTFVKEHLDTRRIVLSVVGNVDNEEVFRLAEKHLGKVPATVSHRKRKKFSGYVPRHVNIHRTVRQARCAIGRTSFSVSDPRRNQYYLLNNILGGAGMNSRLSLALRERRGLVYSVGSQFVPFTDTGLFVISFGTEPKQVDKSINVVRQELDRLRQERMGTRQLKMAKEQIMGQVAMAEESNISFMMMMARSLLDIERIPSLEEIFSKINETRAEDLRELAEGFFIDNQMSYLVMEPASS